jgi:hypothetical protein
MRVKTKVKSEFVVPELAQAPEVSDLRDRAVDFGRGVVTQAREIQKDVKASVFPAGSDTWSSFSIDIDLSDLEKLTTKGEKFLVKVDKLVGIFTAILKIMRLFQNDLKSLSKLLKVVINQLIKALKQFIDSLVSTGVFVTPIIPAFDKRMPGYILPINGGFAEFKAIFTASCLNTKDPTAPKFGPEDTVGGMIIATGAGSNDPGLIADMLKNLDILARFFGFRNPMPPPPVNVSATPGHYKWGAVVATKKATSNRLGVEIRWEHPGDTASITGFKIYRCRNLAGLKKIVLENGVEVERFVYSDEDFNEGEPYEVKYSPLKNVYKYVDFEVKTGEEYHYQVFSTSGFDFSEKYEFLRAVESPLGSKRVSAVPVNCIPLSELKKNNLTDADGNLVDSSKLAGEWINLTVRDILPIEFEGVFKLLDNFSENLSGAVSSSGEALSKYISFLSKKVSRLLKITNEIKNLVQRIMQYQLQGTVLTLNISPEKGGMQNFTDRFNSAAVDAGLVTKLLGSKNDEIEEGFNEAPAPASSDIDSLKGLFVGVGLVYGFPEFDKESYQRFVPEEQMQEYKKQLKRFEKAFSTYKKLLRLEE